MFALVRPAPSELDCRESAQDGLMSSSWKHSGVLLSAQKPRSQSTWVIVRHLPSQAHRLECVSRRTREVAGKDRSIEGRRYE